MGFTQHKKLRRHMKFIHDGNIFKCSSCDFQYTDRSSLMKHVSSKHMEKKFPCHLCAYKASQKYHLNKHIQNVHSKLEGNQSQTIETKSPKIEMQIKNNKFIKLEEDDVEDVETESINSHVKSKPSSPLHKCKVCLFETDTEDSIKMHQKSFHSMNK